MRATKFSQKNYRTQKEEFWGPFPSFHTPPSLCSFFASSPAYSYATHMSHANLHIPRKHIKHLFLHPSIKLIQCLLEESKEKERKKSRKGVQWKQVTYEEPDNLALLGWLNCYCKLHEIWPARLCGRFLWHGEESG